MEEITCSKSGALKREEWQTQALAMNHAKMIRDKCVGPVKVAGNLFGELLAVAANHAHLGLKPLLVVLARTFQMLSVHQTRYKQKTEAAIHMTNGEMTNS